MLTKIRLKGQSFLYVALIVTLVELFLGGSGQIFKLSSITIRQLLFVIMLIAFLYALISESKLKFNKLDSILVLTVLTYTLFSGLLGTMYNHKEEYILGDVSPMLYFLMYFPLYSFINKFDLCFDDIARIMKLCSLVVSAFVFYFYFHYNFTFGKDVFLLREYLDTFGDNVIWARPDGYIVYPGMIFVLCSQIYLFHQVIKQGFNYKSLLEYIVLSVCLLLSMTKGYILSSLLGHMIILYYVRGRYIYKIALVGFLLLFGAYSLASFDFDRFTNMQSDDGVIIRVITYEQSMETKKDYWDVIIGNGFGTELEIRKRHQENSYLDIFVEQGVLGLFCYILFYVRIFINFRFNIPLSVSLISVSFVSLTNPYINNSLGISIIIFCLIFIPLKNSNVVK